MLKESERVGVFIGRCQPFSNAHNDTIQEIIRDGIKPVIILGSINKNDNRNPLSFEERKSLIKKVYPFGVKIIGLEDEDSWDKWMENLKSKLLSEGIKMTQITIYSYAKEKDKTDFVYKNIKYKSEHYIKIFNIDGIKVKNVDEKTCFQGEIIHASCIRASEETAKRNLDSRVFMELKNKFGWWK